MPRAFFKRYVPDHETIKSHKSLRFFGKLLHLPCLWHFSRKSVAMAVAVGLYCAMMPIPFQMVLAAAMAIMLQANLPISVALVWLTNPITMPPVYYGAYKFGAWVTSTPPHEFDFEPSLNWVLHGMTATWQPFLIGCFLLGLILAVSGYFFVYFLWRFLVLKKWRERPHR
ncbi:MAG: DUF2062 domain-containing protein [Zetaproteobacteria bacterium CG_4_9_14_3_um_filter_49_83]|nr:MAG: ATP-binding protein [Zetaproteobacteria bacterium CG1_02_49_23]PIQ33788.1 MAG: ATP-binding protein [Zetaproteobacteria bacterium CG17_big_fil_post_rev_8_21_14_2_50_50_13]PIV29819.1 MAG: DUF2062 domain-containing protein [Zetaproteobacteria bacterium CG02_land_8_20_14_3_00_50_9]PIY56764.1 MAG: DUF2062 domain-containing protein [Zetaproteobacteria bacterium CG_4_10_14_0_8_um_filter_49_80]PJA35951.1 MAG: DUF2062 domain-containing protein [Zetaproteobacteria bacterium CG_4_9_14_3_um_filter_